MAQQDGPEEGAAGRASHGHGGKTPPDIASVAGGALLDRVTRILALIGGALLLVSVVLSVVSITGRYTAGMPVPGDYELVEMICAVAVFLFFPYTHAQGANLTAEFFTSGLPPRWCGVLDVVHDLIFALVAALLAWRLGHGMVDKFNNGDMSILLQVPLWWPYTFAVACLWLLGIVSLWRMAAGIAALCR